MRGVVFGLALAATAGCDRPRAEPTPAPADTRPPEQKRLESTLAKTPCDHAATMELATMMLSTDPHVTIDRCDQYLSACGEDEPVRAMKLHADERLEQWDLALVEANALIERAPTDPTYRIARGRVCEKLRQLDDAAESYRDAIALDPLSVSAPLKLARVYQDQGHPCEAARMLTRAIAQHPSDEARTPLEDRLAELTAANRCARVAKATKTTRAPAPTSSSTPAMPPTMPVDITPKNALDVHDLPVTAARPAAPVVVEGKATIPFQAGHVARTVARIDNQAQLAVLVDTGATYVSIPRRLAQGLGIDVDSGPVVQLQTAHGSTTGHRVKLSEVRVQGVSAQNVDCVVSEETDMGNIGLLGQSFLSRFHMTVDAKRGQIELVPR